MKQETRKRRTRRSQPVPRMGRLPVDSLEPQALLRVWRRVLERRLRSRLKDRVVVHLHDNTHTMLTFQRTRGLWRVRLHHMFLAASDEVLGALAEYIRRTDARASAVLDRYIDRHRAFIRRVPREKLRERMRIIPSGRHHDLSSIFRALNRRYFRNQIDATITYGPAPHTRGPRKSIKMGSYSAESRVIRIHPALDQDRVPRYFVEWIVFHEMLHHIYRARRRDGRRCIHPPEFMAHERRFHDFERAQRWEDRNLDLLLSARVTAVEPVEA